MRTKKNWRELHWNNVEWKNGTNQKKNIEEEYRFLFFFALVSTLIPFFFALIRNPPTLSFEHEEWIRCENESKEEGKMGTDESKEEWERFTNGRNEGWKKGTNECNEQWYDSQKREWKSRTRVHSSLLPFVSSFDSSLISFYPSSIVHCYRS